MQTLCICTLKVAIFDRFTSNSVQTFLSAIVQSLLYVHWPKESNNIYPHLERFALLDTIV